MSRVLFTGVGGRIVLPDLLLVGRADGGHLCVDPPRDVWERGQLSAGELTQWSFLVAATASAMLETLPQLQGGCINYWEAGNWSLHDDAQPAGPKTAPLARRVHLHLLGRSPHSTDLDWKWGEAPRFPPSPSDSRGPRASSPFAMMSARALSSARNVCSSSGTPGPADSPVDRSFAAWPTATGADAGLPRERTGMTEKEIQEQRIRLTWTDEGGKSTAAHGGIEYAVSVDLVGASGKNDWEWLVWVDGRAHFAPRFTERLARDRSEGVEKGRAYAEHVAFNAEEMRERRAAARQ